MLFYFYFNNSNIVSIILLLLPSIVDFIADEIVFYKDEKEGTALIRTPENERIVLNYLRNNNISLVNYINHEAAVKKMSLKMFEEFLERANSNDRNTENESAPEFNFRQIMNQIRRESGLNLDGLSDDQIINIFPQLEGIRLIDQTNNEQQLKYVHIPKDYILTDMKDFNNIEVYNNGKNYLVKPLKWQPNNSLYHTNKPTIISKDTIISDLHLYYLLTVIDAAIGE
nr:MAG TPA: hypothetical protein [Caudoviricetes sp.]